MRNYPDFAYPTKRDWLRDVRKRWTSFRRVVKSDDIRIYCGCAYYPKEVFEWLNQFKKMDKLMKEHYKNA
jgi:phage pi2 protein 07